MKTNAFRKHRFILPFCMVIVLTSCQTPSIFQIIRQEDQPSEEAETIYFPTAEALNEINLTPADGIECDLFVAPDGDDGNPGSETLPWASFQKAADMANPGETICFRGGTYRTQDTNLVNSGLTDAAITFAAYPGEKPVLDGGGKASNLLVLDAGVSYVRISGFSIRNFQIWGLFLTGENRYIHLDHLEIEGGEASIRFTYAESVEDPPLEGPVEHVLLEDSRIHGSKFSAVDCTPGPCNHMRMRRCEVFNTGLIGEAFSGSDGIEFARGYNVTIEDCHVHDNGGDGIDLGSRDREGNQAGIFVRRNQVFRNHLNGVKVWAGGRIENNLIWGSGDSAIWTGSFNCKIEMINNTVAYNMWDKSYSGRNWAVVVGYPEEIPNPEVHLIMINNIFAFNADPLEGGPTGVYLGPGVKIINEGANLYYSNAEEEITVDIRDGLGFKREDIRDGSWTAYSGQGLSNLLGDPLFISGWPEVDLHLQPNSPAMDAGNGAFAPGLDALSLPRDDQPDIGAYEE